MAYAQASILLLTDNGIKPVEYTETEHYQITKQFMDRPDRMLRILMEPEDG
jgi:predicted ATPase